MNNQVAQRVSGQVFDPDALSLEAARAMRQLLDDGLYRDSLRLPKPATRAGLSEPSVFLDYFRKKPNCWGESAFADFYRKRLRSEKGAAAVTLFDLFWLAQPVADDALDSIASHSQLELLEAATVISLREGSIQSNVKCIAPPGVYAMFDVDRTSAANFVYFGTDSQDMVQILGNESRGRHFERSLDMCTGSGVQGLTLARQADEVVCTDLNVRALAYVQANAKLNGLDNVRSVKSDLFTNVAGRFDSITANTPYVPMPDDADARDLPMRGGDLGIEFTFDMLDQLPDYLNAGGIAVIYTSDPIISGRSSLPRKLEERYSGLPFEFSQHNIFRSHPNTQRQRQHFQRHDLTAFDDCILVIRNSKKFSTRQRAWHSSYYWRSRLLRFNYSSDPAT